MVLPNRGTYCHIEGVQYPSPLKWHSENTGIMIVHTYIVGNTVQPKKIFTGQKFRPIHLSIVLQYNCTESIFAMQ